MEYIQIEKEEFQKFKRYIELGIEAEREKLEKKRNEDIQKEKTEKALKEFDKYI